MKFSIKGTQTIPVIDWHKRQVEIDKQRELEKEERKIYFEAIIPEYINICKQVGYCIYQYVGDGTFKPELLLGDYDFISMKNMGVVSKNYEKYIMLTREQPYYIKQREKKAAAKMAANNINSPFISTYPLDDVYYAPWGFKDRWMRIIRSLLKNGYIYYFTKDVHGHNMTFYSFNKNKINELKCTAFVEFI